jgi:predicted TIM-barrel fold metal-dependent hydrolase
VLTGEAHVTVIDSDAHINESLDTVADHIEEPYRSRAPRLLKDTLGQTRILMEGRLYPDPRLRQRHSAKVQGKDLGGTHKGAANAAARLEDLDTDGIDAQVVYGSLGLALSTIRDVDFAAALARALNNYYAEFCDTAPSRLAAMAALPAQDVAASVEELRRAVTERGHVGGTVPPNVNGKDLHHPDFAPLFAEAERLDVPISVHWGNGSHLPAAGTERFDTHFMVHAIGHPVEQMIAFASVLSGGVLDDHPGLRIGFLEAGCGWVAYWVERLEEHYERRSAEMERMTRSPEDYLREGRCFVTAEPDERLVPVVVDVLGDGQVMYASDYPHTDSKFPYSVKAVRERDDLDEAVKDRLLGDNARRYYGPALTRRLVR